MLGAGVTGVLFAVALSTSSVQVNDTPVVTATIEESEVVSLGEFKLTAYCSCSKCCGQWANNRPDGVVYGASGKKLKSGYSIAVDPKVIPYGTEVTINGRTYRADDCGGAIKGNRIDIYFNNHKDALKFGLQRAEVFVERED